MDLIVSHSGADLDAFGSMVGARRLYPGARICLTGPPGRDVRDLLRLYAGEFELIDPRSALRQQIGRLVIVETQHRSRLGRLAALLDRRGIEVHIYDHHPRVEHGIKAAYELIEPVGATTTLLVRCLRDRKIAPTPAEATAMALGIYSDTGSLTFRSTRPEDAQALAWLLGNGADLDAIWRFVHRSPSPDEQALLERLLARTRRFEIKGHEIAVSTAAIPRSYIEELSQVIQRLAAIVGAAALFAVIRIKGAVLVVARSASREIDADQILHALGGGGHPYAASATLRAESLAGAKRRLWAALRGGLRPQPTADALMATPVITLPPDASVDEADLMLRQQGEEEVLIAQRDRLVGTLDRAQVAGAIAHGLGHAPARAYMRKSPPRATLRTTRAEAERALFRSAGSVLPVTTEGAIVGVIHGRDLLRPPADSSPPPPLVAGNESFGDLAHTRLPQELWNVVRTAGQLGDKRSQRVFVVGGCVRDLLLGREILDIDLMVEGDALAFARALARRLGGRYKGAPRFGTASVALPSGRVIHLAQSRQESYARPGALPEVQPSSADEDLRRRDFGINAIAIQVNEKAFGRLLDPTDGRRDLQRRRIRVLHERSLLDDPTRILRAARFAARLGFRLERRTRTLARRAVVGGALTTISRDRVRDEMLLILEEPEAAAALEMLDSLNALAAQSPAFPWDESVTARLARTERELAWFRRRVGEPGDVRLIRLLAALGGTDDDSARVFLSQWAVSERWIGMIDHRQRLTTAARATLNRAETVRPSEIAAALETAPTEILVYLLAKPMAPRARRRIREYLADLRPRPPLLDGARLKSLGGRPGPAFGRVLAAVRAAQLDGEVRSRQQAEALARRLLRRRRRASTAPP